MKAGHFQGEKNLMCNIITSIVIQFRPPLPSVLFLISFIDK
jgi:hypothetical protein